MLMMIPVTPCKILKGIPVAEEAIPPAKAAEVKPPFANAARSASYKK